MADKTYKLKFGLSDGGTQEVEFTAPQGPAGGDGKSAYAYAKEGGYTGTEAEFAAKLAKELPEALPNPHPLTINGEEYDGSEAVEINLASSDASGGSGEAGVDEEAVNALIDTKMKSVKSYGAVGDGVTDDSDAFIAALADKQSVAFVPGGTYKLSKTIVITENSCLELSQDTLLDFTQTSGNCIELRGSATLRGNHGNINVYHPFNGNVISVDTGLDGNGHGSIDPYGNWTPLWQRQRFIYDVNITRTEGGYRGSLTGAFSGTALYIAANYNAGDPNPVTCIWGMTVSGLRIGGAFEYGIDIQCRDTTESGYGNSGDPAWNHDLRIEAVLVACATGVRAFNCNYAHLDVTVEPGRSINQVNGAYVKYAKNGIVLEHCTHMDLSQCHVWDWDANGTLVGEDAKNSHIALIGVCKDVILNDNMYYEKSSTVADVRDIIYTDTPSNFDSLIILQEPFTRWFKPIDNEPYFFDGNSNKLLALKDEYFDTNRVASFTNVLNTGIDADGSIYNGTGTADGYYNNKFETLTVPAVPYHIHTGFIKCTDGDVFVTEGVGLHDDGVVCVTFFDADFKYITHLNAGTILSGGGDYFVTYEELENGFKLTVKAGVWGTKPAYVRFNFHKNDLGNSPIMTINEEIQYRQEGFLADAVKVKGDNVILYSPGGKAYSLSVSDTGALTAVEMEV